MAMGRTDRIPALGSPRCENGEYCFALEVFTILERGIYILINALGLRTPKSHAVRTKNIHRVLCFRAFTFSERRTCIVLSMFFSRAIHGSYKFDRIAYHQYVNHCFKNCTSRTSRSKLFTGRICSTVLDKDGN